MILSLRRRISVRSVSALAVAGLALATVALPGDAVAGGERYPDGIRPPLHAVLEAAAPDALIPVSVVLKDRVSPERIALARAGRTPDEAREAVLKLLKSHARASQVGVLADLRARSFEGAVARVRPLWIGNIVGVDATPAAIRAIAARPEVDWVNHNPKIDVSLGDPAGLRDLVPGTSEGDPAPTAGTSPTVDIRDEEISTAEIECGTDHIGAPLVWNDLGITGEGAVIAVIDSGTCWTHSDIVNQIWVNPGEDVDGDGVVMDPDDENGVDDDGNGFVDDLIGWNFEVGTNAPSDTNSHGSHVAGTVAGDGTAGTQSGMAPDAKIMVIKVGLTFSDEVDVWNAMQYAADNGADSISMSLGWPHAQNPDRATWRQNCENTIDAGTAMVIAAGNEGQGNEPDNVRTPGDVPRIISVGATDCNDVAAGFTSRGPVTWQNVDPFLDHPYPPGLVKPDVSAPGVSTKSHNICNGYSFKSGTSMATPHVAGAVALMVSANPGLGHDEIKQVLMDTSIDLGSSGMDNTFGMGRIDTYEAVNAVFGLTLDSFEVVDTDPNYGNGDGGLDRGEVVTVRLTLRNQLDDATAVNVRGALSTDAPGVTMVHDYGEWPDVAPLGTAESAAPHFSFRIDDGCNFPVDLTLTLQYTDRDDRTTRSRFSVRVGTAFARTLLDDDFETDHGWTASGSSSTGAFVREDPEGVTDSGGNDVQPDDDNTSGSGSLAWVTGNDDNFAGDDDVDAGDAVLVSPPFDATDFEALELGYARWFYAFPSTVPASDFFRVQWTRNGGSTWTDLEVLDAGVASWVETSTPLPASAFGPDLQIRFQAEDSPVVAIDSVVEVLVDDVLLHGDRVECDDFAAPPAQAPNGVGDTLRVQRDGDDLRLTWTAAPVDAQHDAATLYRVYRSTDPDGGFAVDGWSQDPFRVDSGEAATPSTGYFLIVPENGGGTSGEDPS